MTMVSAPPGSSLIELLASLERASARNLIEDDALISPQRGDGDGVDHVIQIVDATRAAEVSAHNDHWLAEAHEVDRETAGRTALDLLAGSGGLVLLAVDFDISASPASRDPDRRSTYENVRETVSGICSQLDGNDGHSSVNVVDLGPSLLSTPLGATVLAIIDGCGLRPRSGVLALAADREGLLLPLGAIATVVPEIAEAIVEQDFLLPLGSYLIVEPPEGGVAEVVRGMLSFGPDSPARRFTLGAGSLLRLELERGASAELTLEPAPGARLGDYPADEPIHLSAPHEITGGALGIILDARGSPTDRSSDPASLDQWLDNLRLM